MSEVWKFAAAHPGGSAYAEARVGWQLVSVGRDPSGDLCVWLLVDPSAAPETVRIGTVGTGWPIPEGCTPLGSVKDGAFMWHLVVVPS